MKSDWGDPMRRWFWAWLAMVLIATPAFAREGGFGWAYYEIGDVHAPPARTTEAGLMLHGGGDWSTQAFRWFVEKAGGGHIVVLRASYGGENGEEIFRDIGGVSSVQTIVFSDRAAARDPRVLEIVRHADGIFLGGGDQSKYVRWWKGTPLNALLDAHVKAGRPIGGTSAGLAVLGAYSYGAMDGGSVTSKEALRDPLGPQVTLVSDFLHLHHMNGIITDSHFAARERLGRLIAFVARLSRQRNDASITGIGVDEQTALCVEADGTARVLSNTDGHAWIVRPMRKADRITPGRALTFTKVPVTGLGANSSIDLNTFEVTAPAFEKVADVKAGVLSLHDR
jgi:cyanophycinase